jgi:hypothetical protein
MKQSIMSQIMSALDILVTSFKLGAKPKEGASKTKLFSSEQMWSHLRKWNTAYTACSFFVMLTWFWKGKRSTAGTLRLGQTDRQTDRQPALAGLS